MIFGSSHSERYKERQEILRKIYEENYSFRKFAFFPVELDNGRKVWLQNYNWKPLVYTSIHDAHFMTDDNIIYRWIDDLQE